MAKGTSTSPPATVIPRSNKPDFNIEIIDENHIKARFRNRTDNHRLPYFMISISVLELVTFAYYQLRSDERTTIIGPMQNNSLLIFNPYRRYEIWRYLTYMLVHAGYCHITFNLIVQLLLGIPLEMKHKFNRVAVIYLGGVIGGALCCSIVDPYSYLVGASGGSYALIAAHLSDLVINWQELKGACCKLIAILSFSFADIGLAIYERHFMYYAREPRQSYGAHLAGAISGLLLGLVVLRNSRVHPWEESVSLMAAIAYTSLIIFTVAYSLLFSQHFPIPDTRDMLWSQGPHFADRL